MPKAEPWSIVDFMPRGEDEEGHAIANRQRYINLIVVKVVDEKGLTQVHISSKDTFDDLSGKANWRLINKSVINCSHTPIVHEGNLPI